MSELSPYPPAPAEIVDPATGEVVHVDPNGAVVDVAPVLGEIAEVAPAPNDQDAWTEEELRKKLQVQVVDVSSGVIANARDKAEQYINEKTGPNAEGNFFKRMKDKIWTGNLAREAIRTTQAAKAKELIIEEGNLYAAQKLDKHYHDLAAEAVTSRFIEQSRTDPEYAQTHVGETNEQMETPLEMGVKELVLKYARGDIDAENLEEAKKQLLSEFGDAKNQEDRNKGLLYADNIIEVAKNARDAVLHNVGLREIDKAISAMQAEARMGVRSEVKQNFVEKAVEKMAQYGINETTAGIAATVALTASAMAVKGAVKAATLGMGTGAVAAAWAGGREAIRVKRDRSTSSREDAESGVVDEKMADQLYNKKSAKDLTAEIEAAYTTIGTDPASIERTLQSLVEARTRIMKSDTENIDLISYSSKAKVEQERSELNYQIAMARYSVDNAIRSGNPAEMASAGLEGKTLNELLDGRSTAVVEQIETDMSQRDEIFQKMRAKQVAKVAAIAFVSGEIAALATQEIAAGVIDDRQGVFESRNNPDQTQATVLASFKNWIAGHEATPHANLSLNSEMVADKVSDKLTLNMPKGFSLDQNPTTGALTFMDANKNPIGESFMLDPKADPAELLQQKLSASGYDVQIAAHTVGENGLPVQPGATISPKEFLQQNPKDFTHVSREMWYDNNTKAFDLKELGLQLGGDHGSGVNANGDYVLKMAGFQETGGSSHGAAAAHVAELQRQGNFKLALSMSKETQAYANLIEFNDKGEAIIPKGSMTSELFAMRDGHLKFIGGYAEASELRGPGADGREIIRPIATLTGENSVSGLTPPLHQELTVGVTARAAVLEDLPTGVPGTVPIYGRRGLRTEPYVTGPITEPINPNETGITAPPAPGAELERITGTDLVPQDPNIAPGTDVDIFQPDGPRAIGAAPNGGNGQEAPEPIQGQAERADTFDPDAPVIDGELVPMDIDNRAEDGIDYDNIEDAEIVDNPEAAQQGTQPGAGLQPQNQGSSTQTTPGTGLDILNDNLPEEYVAPIRGTIERLDQNGNVIANPRRELESNRPAIESSRPALAAAAQTLSLTAGRDFSNPASFLNDPNQLAIENNGTPEPRSVIRERSGISSYLEDQRVENPGAYALIERTANTLPPMTGTNRVSVNLLASEDVDAAEYTELSRVLAGYADQRDANGERLPAGTYEVNVSVPTVNGAPTNNAAAVVQQFVSDYEQQNGVRPPINIVSLETRAADDTAAYTRKMMADATLRRSLNRVDQEQPLYIESQDVDDREVDSLAVTKILEQLDSDPNKDAVQLEFDKTPDYVFNNDLLLTSQLASRIHDTLLGNRSFGSGASAEGKASVLDWNTRIVANGWNAAVSADAYARGKGFNPKIETAMRAAKEVGKFLGDDGNEVIFGDLLNSYAEDFLSSTGNVAKAESLTSRMLASLGLRTRDFSLRNGKVEVKNWSGMSDYLGRHRNARYDSGNSTQTA